MVRIGIEREGSRVVLAARTPDGASFTLAINVGAAGAVAACLTLASHPDGIEFHELSVKGQLTTKGPTP